VSALRIDPGTRGLVALALAAAVVAAALGGCGSGGQRRPASPAAPDAAVALDAARTRPFGRGAAFRPPPYGPAVAVAARVGSLTCAAPGSHPYGAHIELFAAGLVVAVPAGIGVAPPQRRDGAVVASGRCVYPLRTLEPTGVIEVDAPSAGRALPTLGQLFAVWGQPLGARRLAGFAAPRGGPVTVFVDGRRWPGDPRAVPLGRHAQIVLEVGPRVEPHPAYRFAPGL
jgi:hypothetical protein